MGLVTKHQVYAVSYLFLFPPPGNLIHKNPCFSLSISVTCLQWQLPKKFAELTGRSQSGSTLLVTQSESCIHVCTLRAGGHKARSPAMVSLSSCCQAKDDPAKKVHGSKLKQNHFLWGRQLDVTLPCYKTNISVPGFNTRRHGLTLPPAQTDRDVPKSAPLLVAGGRWLAEEQTHGEGTISVTV